MKLSQPSLNTAVQINLDRIILFRGETPVLSSTLMEMQIKGVEGEIELFDKSSGHKIRISTVENGFSIQAEGCFTISFEMDGAWFGHGELLNQRLPLNKIMLPLSAFETYDNGPQGQSCILTPIWFSSSGAWIHAHTPVKVGINQPTQETQRYHWSMGTDRGPFNHRPFDDLGDGGDGMITFQGENLNLTIGCETDARQSCQKLIQNLGHPENTPPDELFVKPTWTTWAGMKTDVSQEKVLQFAEEILEHDYPYGVMEIDDRWQTYYGDFTFDPFRFPSPARMVRALHNIGFKVTTWVIPFFDPESSAYQQGKEKDYFVKNEYGEVYPVTWWQGKGALLDVTNPSALHWFYENLRALQEGTGLDGFKFDAGEACFLPEDAITYQPITRNEYTHHYINFISEKFSMTEVRSGWLNQKAPIFFRQWDKWSTWGTDNGLHSVISGILALGLTGYPFILPDMVGGNAYDVTPDAELMIRWTQMNALLPAIQFSIKPWEYGLECDEICRHYAELHTEHSGTILDLARNATWTGEPIIRPVWWKTPLDENALRCDDQFLLGDDILVAPVVEKGARSRKIYLPKGKWKDIRTGDLFEGERYLSEYPASLEELPVFERVEG